MLKDAVAYVHRFCKHNHMRCLIACPFYDRHKKKCRLYSVPHTWRVGKLEVKK